MDLFGGELVALDGSKFKAVNNRKRNFTDEKLTKALMHIDEKIAEYLQALSTAESETATRPDLTATEVLSRIRQFRERKQHYQQVQRALAASGESQISLTDPDSRSMPIAQGVDVCYNVEVAVDSKHKLIVTHEVTTAVTDKDQLAPMAKAAKQVLGAVVPVVGDNNHGPAFLGRQIRKRDRDQHNIALVRHCSNPHHRVDCPRKQDCFQRRPPNR